MTIVIKRKAGGTADIERWQPSRWDEIIGNQQLKEYLLDMIRCIRKEGHQSGFNALITGPSRGGKTSTVRFAIKCLGCLNLDFETYNPCHSCAHCVMKNHLYGNDGWENFIDYLDEAEVKTSIRYQYLPLDCARLGQSDIDACIEKIRGCDDCVRVITLDEVHRLVQRNLDDQLLKPVEDYAANWIAMSALMKKENESDQKKLEKMFQNRFSFRINTEKPTVPQMATWLAMRCEEFGLTCDFPRDTLHYLAERSNQLAGMALQVLNKAHKRRSKELTRQLVDEHVFDLDD
ncbi:MAG: hypothetical protein ACR2FY_21825 [Pirellulaceae bacterium]